MKDNDNEESTEKCIQQTKEKSTNILLMKSLFQHRPATVFFDYPFSKKRKKPQGLCITNTDIEVKYSCTWERNCIKNAFKEAGCIRNETEKFQSCDWIKPPAPGYFKKLKCYNRVNHYPGSWCLGRKDRLLKCIQRAKRFASSSHVNQKDAYDFFPEGWKLPQDYQLFQTVMNREQQNSIFILKPSASSRGRGIKLIHKGNANVISPKKKCIIQRYICDPYLINGKKFDLRLYVLVTSFDPLKAYIFKEGFVRFSSFAVGHSLT